MAHPASARIEAQPKPPQRAEKAHPIVRDRERREILRHAKYHLHRGLTGEVSAYVYQQMRGRISESVIDAVLVSELIAQERRADVGLNALQSGVRQVFDIDRQTRRELEGVA